MQKSSLKHTKEREKFWILQYMLEIARNDHFYKYTETSDDFVRLDTDSVLLGYLAIFFICRTLWLQRISSEFSFQADC